MPCPGSSTVALTSICPGSLWRPASSPRKPSPSAISSSLGDAIDYVNVRRGQKTSLGPQLVYNLGAHWRLNLAVTRERMDVQAARLYTALVGQATVIYHLNTKVFVRGQFQYYDYDYNTANYVVPVSARSRKLFSQILVLLQAQSQDGVFRGLHGQLPWRARPCPDPEGPHAVRQGRVRAQVLDVIRRRDRDRRSRCSRFAPESVSWRLRGRSDGRGH